MDRPGDDNVVDAFAPIRVSTLLRGGDEAVLTASGVVDRTAAARISSVLSGLLDAGARRLVVDLSRVGACDPILNAVLDRAQRRVHAGGGWLVVDGRSDCWTDRASIIEIFESYRQARSDERPAARRPARHRAVVSLSS